MIKRRLRDLTDVKRIHVAKKTPKYSKFWYVHMKIKNEELWRKTFQWQKIFIDSDLFSSRISGALMLTISNKQNNNSPD